MTGHPRLEELLSLRGKVALVAGGGGGIGRAIVGRFLEAGARTVSVDRPGVTAEPEADAVECDVTDPEAVRRGLEDVVARHGRLDVVVHAAGVTRDAVVWKMSDEDWSEVLRTNLDSAFFLLRAAVPVMRNGGGGSIVLVSSINGERGKFGQANYAASKAGMNALARTVARETGSFGIRVNAIAPGFVETEMTRGLPEDVRLRAAGETVLGRPGQPDDIARAALFLATEAGRHVTGQVLRVDGGQFIA